MGMRNGLAVEYEAAPLVRLANELIAVGAGGNVDLTSRVPYKALIDGAPYVNILLGYLLDDANLGPAIGIGPNSALPNANYQRLNRAAGFVVVRVRKVLPREISASTTLIDGNSVWIINRDQANAYSCQLIIEAPSLNWV